MAAGQAGSLDVQRDDLSGRPGALYTDYILFKSSKRPNLCGSLVLLAEDDPLYDCYERMPGFSVGLAALDGAAEVEIALFDWMHLRGGVIRAKCYRMREMAQAQVVVNSISVFGVYAGEFQLQTCKPCVSAATHPVSKCVVGII